MPISRNSQFSAGSGSSNPSSYDTTSDPTSDPYLKPSVHEAPSWMRGAASFAGGVVKGMGHDLSTLADWYITGQQGDSKYMPKDIAGYDYNNQDAPGNTAAIAKNLGAVGASVALNVVPVEKVVGAVAKPIIKGAAKAAAPLVERALATETGALVSDTAKAAAAKAAAAKATVIDTKDVAKNVTSRAVASATNAPKAAAAGTKAAVKLNPAKEKILTAAENRENYLTEAAKNLDTKYNRTTGRDEFVSDTSKMVIQKPITRSGAFKSAYEAQLNQDRAEAIANAALRKGEPTTPFSSSPVKEATQVAKADVTPSYGRSTNAAVQAAQETAREAARAHTGLVKDVNASGGNAEKAIKGLEKDVETSFPKPGQAQGKGKGKGKGSGNGSGEGSGSGSGSGSGNGSGSGAGNGSGRGTGPTGSGTGIPGTGNARGGRPAPVEEEPISRPYTPKEKLKPLPYDGGSSGETQLSEGKLSLLTRNEEELASPNKTNFSASEPSKHPLSSHAPDGASKIISGNQLSASAAVNAGARAALQPELSASTSTPIPTDVPVPKDEPPGGGGGGGKPLPLPSGDIGEQNVHLRRVY